MIQRQKFFVRSQNNALLLDSSTVLDIKCSNATWQPQSSPSKAAFVVFGAEMGSARSLLLSICQRGSFLAFFLRLTFPLGPEAFAYFAFNYAAASRGRITRYQLCMLILYIALYGKRKHPRLSSTRGCVYRQRASSLVCV